MKVLINNLSINQMIREYHAIDINNIFIDLARCLRILNISTSPNEILLTGNFDSFLEIEVSNGKKLRDELKRCPDREARGLVLARLSSYTKIENLESHNIIYSLSLFVDECWKDIKTELNESSTHLKNIKNIPCFHSGNLLKTISRGAFLIGMRNQNGNELIDKRCAEVYYHPETEEIYTRLMRSNDSTKQNIINRISELTCAINGFDKNPKISKKNNRDVYFNASKDVYLCVDSLHGTFEIHNKDGTHKFEINCKGDIIEKGDKSGRHNINIQ